MKAQYDSRYEVEVNSKNEVKVRDVERNKLIPQHLNKTIGYLQVRVHKVSKALHTVICTAFHGAKPSSAHEVDHIDRDKLNNHPTNLRWVLHSENQNNRVISMRSKNITHEQYNDLFTEYASGKHTITSITIWANDKFNRNSQNQGYSQILKGTTQTLWHSQLPNDVVNKVREITVGNTKYIRK